VYNLKQKSFIDGFANGMGLQDIGVPQYYSSQINNLGDFTAKTNIMIQQNENNVSRKLEYEVMHFNRKIKKLKEKLGFKN